MNMNELLTSITQGFFILLGIVTAADFIRHRDKMRRDVALMVWSLALLFLIQVIVQISGVTSPRWLSLISAAALIAQPYLLLRVVRYLHPTPRRVMRAALIGMVVSWLAVALIVPTPSIISLLIILYFAAINGYAMLAFVRGALRTSGVVRQRLRFAAAGSGLLALVLLLIALAALVPAVQSVIVLIALIAVVVSGVCYYVGFAPPRWLRRSWQFAELNNFLARISSAPADERLGIAESMLALSRAANQAVGGMAAGIAQQDEAGEQWLWRYGVGEAEQIALAGDGIVGRVWQQASGQFVREAAETGASDRRLLESVGADTMIAVPIRIEDRTWGVLLVFLESGSLFIEDDLNLVMLLVRQSAIFLENSTLLEQIRKQENDKRVAVETRLTRLLNTIAEAVISIDTSYRIVLFNQSAERYFGYSADEMLGQPIDRLLPDHVVGRHEKFIRDFADGSNIARGMGERRTELSAKRKDGSVFPIEASISKLTEKDQVILTVFLRDMTERKQAEEALRASEGRYQLTLDNMLEGCQIIGFDWRYLYINESAARYGRMAKEELLGHTVMEKYPGIEASEMFAAMRECMENRTARLQEFEFSYGDSSQAWFEFSIQPVPEGIFILSLDITERKEAEAAMQRLNEELEERVAERTMQLQAANKELEAFSYSVSHDLRAPLRAIDGFSRALEQEFEAQLDDEGKRYISRIRNGSQRMGQLIDDLLELSRLSRSEMQREPVDLSEMARQIAAELGQQYPDHNVDFKLADGMVVEGDARLMRVALSNLLANAWKYTGKQSQPRVEFGIASQNGQPTYFVRDNGAGFDMTYSDKLFGVFQRLHGANEFPGNGIGLATVQRIMHRHGGDIWAEAEVDKGATFFFSL